MKWLFLFLLVPAQLILAQSKPVKVHTYVEQMPELPGGGGMPKIISAILHRLQVSKVDLDTSENSPIIYFEVSPIGKVQNARLTTSTQSAGLDAALLAAVNALPTFKPGYQSGRPVTVGLNVRIACIKSQ